MLPLIACSRCAASGRVRDAELVPLDDQGRPQAATVARLRHWTPLVEDLPCGPTAPCPVCHGHRLVPRRGHRPYASARAAEQARRRGTARTCVWCDGSGLAGWVAVRRGCAGCQGRGQVLSWAGDVDSVVPDEVNLDQPADERFLAAWLAATTWTVTHTDPARERFARRRPREWASEQITGTFGAVLLGVWAPDAGWESAAEQALVARARDLLAARTRPLTIGQVSSLYEGRRVSTRLEVEVIGVYGWPVRLLSPPVPPPAPERPRVAVPSPAVTRWIGLEAHVRLLLAALYDEDQQRERAEYTTRRDDFSHHRPAATWRWIDPGDPAITAALHTAGVPEARLDALVTTLVGGRLVDHRAGIGRGAVQLTRLGRQTVRAGLLKRPRGRPPEHLLGRAWSTLAELYDAGDAGLDRSRYTGDSGSLSSRSTLDRLRYHRDGPLVEEVAVPQPIGQPARRVRLSPAGRAFYERTWAEHDHWFPGVRATPPPGVEVVTSRRLTHRPRSTRTSARMTGRRAGAVGGANG